MTVTTKLFKERTMKFAYTILYVTDVHRAVAFYEEAFGLEKRFIHESGQYAEMETGGTALSFVANELATSHWFDISAAKRDLGYSPRVSINEGLKTLEEWLKKNK